MNNYHRKVNKLLRFANSKLSMQLAIAYQEAIATRALVSERSRTSVPAQKRVGV